MKHLLRLNSRAAVMATAYLAAGPRRLTPRRGMAVLLVLGMLAMTLALSYASLRGQATVAQLAENQGRSEAARLAAESGIYDALRKMSESTWAGIDVPITGNLSDNSWFEVSFATGDAQLTPADPIYGEFAYRVTITSTGYANDPEQPSVRAIHKVEAIVQLARRTILAEPANWSALMQNTVYQWGNRDVTVQEPVRIDGRATILGRMQLSPDYPKSTSSRNAYLSGLNGMRIKGRGDYRPFDSPLTIALLRQDPGTLTLLTSNLGLVTVDSLAATTAPVAHPNLVTSYKLYPGGKNYQPPIIQTTYGSTLAGAGPATPLVLKPDPVTNPLGIYRSRNSLSINSNVHIQGTLISEGTTPDIQVYGSNVKLQGVNLAPIEGATQTYQLPVALVKDDLKFHSNSDATVQGLAVVYDEFELRQGTQATRFALQGNLLSNGLRLRGRDSWFMSTAAWSSDYDDFSGNGGLLGGLLAALLNSVRSALGLGAGEEVFFPEFMQHVRGFTVKPNLTFQPAESGVQPHWHQWSQPVYQKDPADAGLRWNLIRWVEGS